MPSRVDVVSETDTERTSGSDRMTYLALLGDLARRALRLAEEGSASGD